MSVRPICRATVRPGIKPVTRVGVSSGSDDETPWILAAGAWNDDGEWIDSENWDDGE